MSHTVLGGSAVSPLIADPTKDWVVARELAHRWWGNRVTATTLSELSLNEGVVTYMVAASKESRWGPAAYGHEIALARQRWERRRRE